MNAQQQEQSMNLSSQTQGITQTDLSVPQFESLLLQSDDGKTYVYHCRWCFYVEYGPKRINATCARCKLSTNMTRTVNSLTLMYK
jgi:hypothetical protein